MSQYQSLNFKLSHSPIDYFQLQEKDFKPHCNVTKEKITLSPAETYIEYPKHFNTLDLQKKETIVFNFPVGKGKTTICYDLIKEYDKLGWYIIVCSPFVKLVNKDLKKIEDRIGNYPVTLGGITGKLSKVISYVDLSSEDELFQEAYENWAYTCNTHIMTINCLLGNPGDNAIEQSINKSNYIDNLLDATKGKKVVLFIDELHESIHNFEPTFVANLLRWKDRVQKVYVASATFTPATIPAIKAVSLLTDSYVHIYESDRSKNNNQADIYLHVTPYQISGYSKQFLNTIDQNIQSYKKAGRTVNILTGTKSIAEKIAGRSFKNVVKTVRQRKKHKGKDEVYLLTSDTDLEYQKNSNNIGTNFKTGVDIEDPNEVLFIVIPTITNSLHYGIFTDGIPSIVQGGGRLRNGGDIHIFISEPSLLIDPTNTDYPIEIAAKKMSCKHYLLNNSYQILNKEYSKKVNKLSAEIPEMENGIFQASSLSLSTEDRKKELALWYPNFHEFLMDKGQRVLVNDYPSFGKYLAPYVLWACLNDQFQNARLKEIVYHQPDIKVINISANNRKTLIQDLLIPLNTKIKNQSFREFVNGISENLKHGTDEDGEVFLHEYKFEDSTKSIPSNKLMKDQPGFIQELLEEAIFIKTGNRLSLSKKEYILSCLHDVQQGNVYHEIKIREAYRKLLELREKYINWYKSKVIIENGRSLIPSKVYLEMPDELFYQAVEVFNHLKRNDKLIPPAIVSILQKFNEDISDKSKKRINTEIEGLFINVTDQRVRNKKFYALEENYIVEIQNSFSIPLI